MNIFFNKKLLSLISILILFCKFSLGQCSGGNYAGTITLSTTNQKIAINGNSYYQFYAIAGNHYSFNTVANNADCEITILDSLGNYAGGYAHNGVPAGFILTWGTHTSGNYRALINRHACQASTAFLDSMVYFYMPYHSFPKDSAQWSIKGSGIDSNGNSYIYTSQYKMRGDTLLNGILYSKIYHSDDINYVSSTDSLHCFIREDSAMRKVFVKYPYYLFNDSSEILLYDFNLQLGDTFNVRSIISGLNYQFYVAYQGNNQGTNIDLRHWTTLFTIGAPVWGPGCDNMCQWIEGIGNACFFLYTEIPLLFCDSNDLGTQCFWQNGIYVTGGTFCDFATSVNVTKNKYGKDLITIAPNPVKFKSVIRGIDLNDITEIIIVNDMGVPVKLINQKNISGYIISASDFSPGVYLIIAKRREELYSVSKFIVEY